MMESDLAVVTEVSATEIGLMSALGLGGGGYGVHKLRNNGNGSGRSSLKSELHTLREDFKEHKNQNSIQHGELFDLVRDVTKQVSEVKSDVSYIRGKLES